MVRATVVQADLAVAVVLQTDSAVAVRIALALSVDFQIALVAEIVRFVDVFVRNSAPTNYHKKHPDAGHEIADDPLGTSHQLCLSLALLAAAALVVANKIVATKVLLAMKHKDSLLDYSKPNIPGYYSKILPQPHCCCYCCYWYRHLLRSFGPVVLDDGFE